LTGSPAASGPGVRGGVRRVHEQSSGEFVTLFILDGGADLVIGARLIHPFSPSDDDEIRIDLLQSGGSALAVILFVAIVLGLIVFRVLMKRLRLLGQSLTAVADGDLGCRVDEPGSDELGDLGHSFNIMASSLQVVVEKLEFVDERRRQFLADVSHELRTPITSVKANLDALLADIREDPSSPGSDVGSQEEALSLSLEEVDHMSHLVEDLLEMARMDSPRFELDRAEVVLQRVAKGVVDRLRLSAKNRKIRLSTHFSPEPVRREVDSRRIAQVLTNLLVNAIRSTDEDGIVEVHVREIPGEDLGAVIEIHDDGPGIPDDKRREVFDRFESTTRGGTGLGLSIVRKLTEAHGGRVELEPRPGGGTIARVLLP